MVLPLKLYISFKCRHPASMRRILLLDLNYHSWLDDQYDAFLLELSRRCELTKAQTIKEAFQHLAQHSQCPISAIIVWSPDLVASVYNEESCKKLNYAPDEKAQLKTLAKAVAQFTQAGGTTIFGGPMPFCVDKSALKDFFLEIWGLPWQHGQCHEIYWVLNKKAKIQLGHGSSIRGTYSMKALSLKGVAEEDLVYICYDRACLDAGHEQYEPIDTGPAVFAEYGLGKLGYVGDVNNEMGTQELMFAMMGL